MEKEKAMAFLKIRMVQNTKDSGTMIKCMVKEIKNGVMVDIIKANTSMTKDKEKVYTRGQMVENMKENGTLESNMV